MIFTPAWWVCVEKSLECMPPQPAASLSLYIQDLGQSFSLHQSIPPNQYIHVTYRPTTIHWCTGTSPYFWHNTNIIYWTSYRDIYDAFTYVLNKHGKALSSISAHPPSTYIQDGTHDKHMHASNWACQPYRLLSPWARHKAIPFLFWCYITYHIVYRIMTTVSGYVSLWKNVSLQAW